MTDPLQDDLFFAFDDLTDHVSINTILFQDGQRQFSFLSGNHDAHTNTHVVGVEHVTLGDVAPGGDHVEDGQDLYSGFVDFGAQTIARLLQGVRSIYFIGIGGVSMSSLAIIANSNGIKTAGSDRTLSEVTDSLEKAGIEVQEGHEAKNVKNYTVVVYNAAIHADNPEYYYAATHNYFMIYRSDFLGYIISEYGNSIGVAGTHGKSTATAMIYSILNTAGLDPTVMNGAVIPKINSQYHPYVSRETFFISLGKYCEFMHLY